MGIFTGVVYCFKGISFIFKHSQLWKYIIWPFFLYLIVAIGIIVADIYVAIHHVPDTWGKLILFFISMGIISVILFLVIASVLTEAYMCMLSAAVEKIVRGHVREEAPNISFFKKIWVLIAAIPVALLFILLNLIPVVGQIITCYCAGMSNLEYPLERRDLKKSEVRKRGLGKIIGFGAAWTLSLIPPFTLISKPIGVVGGTLLFLEEIE